MPESQVLFVDDEAAMRAAVTQWLELSGFAPTVHDNATAALERLSTDFPGVLVTDLKMEGIDGLELLRRAQQIDPELPVVVITGYPDSDMLNRILARGPVTVLKKPLKQDQLKQAVRILGPKEVTRAAA